MVNAQYFFKRGYCKRHLTFILKTGEKASYPKRFNALLEIELFSMSPVPFNRINIDFEKWLNAPVKTRKYRV